MTFATNGYGRTAKVASPEASGGVEEGLERFTSVIAGRAWDILLWPYIIMERGAGIRLASLMGQN
jgi:hypothetical protein